MTGVARLHCLYLAGISVVRCQIVFTVVVYLLSVSVFQALKLFSPGRVSVYLCPSWRPCTAEDICTSTVFGFCTCTASSSHLHCVWSCLIKTICFSLAIGSRAFCTVTIGFYLQKNACRFIIFFLSVFKVLLLNIRKTYSDYDCWETNLRLSPFKGDQHHAYLPNGPRTACNLLKCLF